MTDNTQELDEILELLHNSWLEDDYNPKDIDAIEAKQAILDWHNKQVEAVLDNMLVDVSDPNANIDQAEMIELINLYINKLKEGSNEHTR